MKTENEKIVFHLNGTNVQAYSKETIIETADRYKVNIPRLCYKKGLRADGNCRACVVEIEGENNLSPSCWRFPKSGMKIRSNSARALHSQKMNLELLLGDMPKQNTLTFTKKSELDFWTKKLNVKKSRFPERKQPIKDHSHPAISVQMEACIQCTRCLSACREEQVNDVIGFAWRGKNAKIVFDFDDNIGSSSCVGCGECVQACPTGALTSKSKAELEHTQKKVPTICP